jgi:predicted CXXCH cytochrome family protein
MLVLATVPISASLLAQDPAAYTHDAIKVGKKKIEVGTGKEATKIESLSQYCLSCHQGGTDDTGSPAERTAPHPRHTIGGLDRSHPIDIPFPESSSDYVPIRELDRRLRLTAGQITCLTCHDAEASDHGLNIPNDRSQICMACHRR